jgi:hypothetical protein
MDAMGDDLKGEPVYRLPAESVALQAVYGILDRERMP